MGSPPQTGEAYSKTGLIRSFRCMGTDKEQITSPVNTQSIDPKQTEQHFVLNDFHLKDLQYNKMAMKKRFFINGRLSFLE